jgi:hypothetical protein
MCGRSLRVPTHSQMSQHWRKAKAQTPCFSDDDDRCRWRPPAEERVRLALLCFLVTPHPHTTHSTLAPPTHSPHKKCCPESCSSGEEAEVIVPPRPSYALSSLPPPLPPPSPPVPPGAAVAAPSPPPPPPPAQQAPAQQRQTPGRPKTRQGCFCSVALWSGRARWVCGRHRGTIGKLMPSKRGARSWPGSQSP